MNMITKRIIKFGVLALLLFSPELFAHGERALESFIRMRTIQWYDIQWSKNTVDVNQEIVLSGRFHVAEDWPNAMVKPDSAFLNLAIPTPVLVRTATYINGAIVNNSMALKLGGDYDFKIVLKGRVPGRYHIHPMMNLRDIGVIVGPGMWIDVQGAAADFKNPVTTLAGETVDLETYGTANGILWHSIWLGIAALWLLWWLRRPMFIPRYKQTLAGDEDALITSLDRKVGGFGILGTLVLITASFVQADQKYPESIPLQTGRAEIEPLPMKHDVAVKIKRATYRVVQRSLHLTMEVSNKSDKPVELGELNSATLRFFNPGLQRFDSNYPKELAVENGLDVQPSSAIAPGATATLTVKATDVAWHNQKLASITKDTDSNFGAMLFFYDNTGERYLASISTPVIPDFGTN
jgi:methane/ammonia monooxygenase subunit B